MARQRAMLRTAGEHEAGMEWPRGRWQLIVEEVGSLLLAGAGTVLAVAAASLLAGCVSVLPSSTTNSAPGAWADYTAARQAFDAVEIDRTTDKDLRTLGFNNTVLPNIRLLNYVDVVNLFGAGWRPEDLPQGIQHCRGAQDKCFAYVVTVRNTKNRREGNVAMDLFGFRKSTRTRGWEFAATMVLVNDVVVYKLWNGTPVIESVENQRTPLGPLQNLSGILPKPSL